MKCMGVDTDALYVNMLDVTTSDLFDYYFWGESKCNKNDIYVDPTTNKMILNDMYGLRNK